MTCDQKKEVKAGKFEFDRFDFYGNKIAGVIAVYATTVHEARRKAKKLNGNNPIKLINPKKGAK